MLLSLALVIWKQMDTITHAIASYYFTELHFVLWATYYT